jgi:hypothetical protein
MVYFVAAKGTTEFVVNSKLPGMPEDNGFGGVTYEADPDTLDLNVLEREYYSKGNGAMQHGYRVNSDKVPKVMLWPGGNNALPEVIMHNCLAVSPRFCDLVEQFEPGVHQFFPVDIYKDLNNDPVATYYWINVCNRIDSVDGEKSGLFWKPAYDGTRGLWRSKDDEYKLPVFDLSKIGEAHLWVDPYVSQTKHFFVSNAFAEAARGGNFLGLALSEREEA